MPAPTDKPGLSELEQVLKRIGRSSLREGLGAGLGDEHYAQIARHIYDGQSEGPLPYDAPQLYPKTWVDHAAQWHDPEAAMRYLMSLPPINYAEASNNIHSLPEMHERTLAMVENSLAGGRGFGASDVGPYTGIGWSREEINRERDRTLNAEWMPGPGELSPGDYERHQRIRDINFLRMMAERRKGLYDPNTGEPLEQPFIVPNDTPGASWDPIGVLSGQGLLNTPRTTMQGVPFRAPTDQQASAELNRRTNNALYWHQKGRGAKHAFGSGTVFSTNQTANFPQYGGWAGTAAAMENPDYLFGQAGQNVFSPMEWAMNRVATLDADKQDSDLMAYTRKAGGLGYLGASLRDTLSNAWNYDREGAPLADAMRVAGLAQINKASPLLPTEKYAPDPWERSRLYSHAKQTLENTRNLDASDHYYGRTGQDMSFLGQMGASLGSAMLDPTIFIPGAFAGKGARLARVSAEAGEEIPMGVAITGATALAERPKPARRPTLPEAVSLNSWTGKSADRPDLPPETPEQRRSRIQKHVGQGGTIDRAVVEASRLNKLLPTPDPIPKPGVPVTPNYRREWREETWKRLGKF